VTDSIFSPPERSPRNEHGSASKALIASALKDRTARYRFLTRALAVLLGGYLFFDRAFAWIHVPGTPLFVGEFILALGLYVVIRSGEAVRFIRLSLPMQFLVAFMGFGFMLLILGATSNPVQEAVRDSAIFYYGLFAIVLGALVRAWEPAYDLFIRWYTRIIPAFLMIGTVRLLLANRQTGLFLPDSEVLITSHKPGNVGVQAVIAIAFLLLVVAPEVERRDRVRNVLLTVGGLLLLALAGTQNRGTLVAGFIALFAIYLAGKRARPAMGNVLVVLIAAMLLAFAFDVRFDLERREVSISQLFSNITDINVRAEPGTGEDDGTIAWRLELWDLVLDDTLTNERFLSGFGFGPNLAGKYGFYAGAETGPELRNPHNSHLSVLARMGLIGTSLWVALWAVWYVYLWRARKRLSQLGESQKAAVLSWCMVGAMAALINGFFDPSLEGPQAAVWLWSIYGLGSVVATEGTVGKWRSRSATNRQAW